MLRIFCRNHDCKQEYVTNNSNFDTKCGFCGSTDIRIKMDLTHLEPEAKNVISRLLRNEGSWLVPQD